MRSIFILLLSTTILFGVYDSQCKYCHSSKITLSKIYTKKQWHKYTYHKDKTLRDIHKRNLDVYDYLNSSLYEPSKLYDDMSFFAKKEEKHIEIKRVEVAEASCIVCHNNKQTLANLWQLSQWKELLVSSQTLKTAHKSQPTVIKYINSKEYNQNLKKLINRLSQYAPNMQKIKLKSKNISFLFEKNNGKKEEAQKIFTEIKKSLKHCNIKTPINLHISITNQDTSVASAIVSVFTLFIAPINSTNTWTMVAKYKNMTFKEQIDIKHSSGFFGKDHKTLTESIDKLMSRFKKNMNLSCK